MQWSDTVIAGSVQPGADAGLSISARCLSAVRITTEEQ
jgi:hypothetical protein